MTESPLMHIGAALCSITASNADVERRFAARRRMMKDPNRWALEENKWHKLALLKANLKLFDEISITRAREQHVYVGGNSNARRSESRSGVQELLGLV